MHLRVSSSESAARFHLLTKRNTAWRHGRLLGLVSIMTVSALFTVLFYNQLASQSPSEDDKASLEEVVEAAPHYNPGHPAYLAPQWEWARDTSIVYTWVVSFITL